LLFSNNPDAIISLESLGDVMMKKKIALILSIVVLSLFITGCKSTTNDKKQETKKEETKEEVVKEETIADKIEYEEHKLGNIVYKAPKDWEHKSSDKWEYYYPDYNDTNVFLMLGSSDVGEKNIDKETFSTFVDSFTEGFTTSSGMSNARVNSKTIDKKDDFYIGKLEIKADLKDSYRDFLLTILYDNKTGKMYLFCFTTPEKISEDNISIYERILETIKLR